MLTSSLVCPTGRKVHSVNWREEYKKRLALAEDAVKSVKSGDYVVFAQPEAPTLGLALVSRAGDISGVKIMGGGGSDLPIYDATWYDAFPDAFALETSYVLPLIRDLIAQKKSDFIVSGLFGVP